MTKDKGILIKNIYYMLTYAFQVLKHTNFESISGEDFDKIQDLFAEILSKGIASQLKQGLYREYVEKQEDLPVMHGKIDINTTIKNKMQQKQLLGCQFDELSENNIFNQILKTTATILIKSNNVDKDKKAKLKMLMLYFDNVELVDPKTIRWKALRFQRNNKTYEMLINICYFVLDGMLQTTEKGDFKMAQFSDEHMARLYEKFVLEYYRNHYPQLKARPAQVQWNLSGDAKGIEFLPKMQTDITLQNGNHTLIIDTKYYSKTMQYNPYFEATSYHSSNMYQILAYVTNWDKEKSGDVSGMLLYARTGEEITPNGFATINDNKIAVKTLDLNCDFADIAKQLNKIISEHFTQ